MQSDLNGQCTNCNPIKMTLNGEETICIGWNNHNAPDEVYVVLCGSTKPGDRVTVSYQKYQSSSASLWLSKKGDPTTEVEAFTAQVCSLPGDNCSTIPRCVHTGGKNVNENDAPCRCGSLKCDDGKFCYGRGSACSNRVVEPCPKGHFSTYGVDPGDGCAPCEAGKFADTVGATACTACADTDKTTPIAAESASACVDKCLPGTYRDGSFTCAACAQGKFSFDPESPSCKSCPEDMKTASTHSTKYSDCIPKCKKGEYSPGSDGTCYQCPKSEYSTAVDSAACNMCPAGKKTFEEGSNSADACVDKW